MEIKEWINNCLFNLFGFSEQYLVDFFLNLSMKSSNREELIHDIENKKIIKLNIKTRSFMNELWKKILPLKAENKTSKTTINSEKKIKITKSISLEEKQKNKIKRWSLSTIPNKNEGSNDSINFKEKARSKEFLSNFSRLKDLTEKKDLEERIKKKKLDKQKRNLIKKMCIKEELIHKEDRYRKVISEMTLNEISLEIENAKNTSRHDYLKKRQEDIMELLRREIEWEEFTFAEDRRTKEENIRLKMKKKNARACRECIKKYGS